MNCDDDMDSMKTSRYRFIERCARRSCWCDTYVHGIHNAMRILDKVLPQELTIESLLGRIPELISEKVYLQRAIYDDDGECSYRDDCVGPNDATWVFWDFVDNHCGSDFRDYLISVKRYLRSRPILGSYVLYIEAYAQVNTGMLFTCDQSVELTSIIYSAFKNFVPAEHVAADYLHEIMRAMKNDQ